MARIVLFQHLPGESFLHRLDPRAKLLALICLTTVAALGGAPGAVVTSVGAVWSIATLRVPFHHWLRGLRGLIWLCGLVVVARALTAEDPVTGLEEGALMASRLVLMALLGAVYVACTTLSRTKAAVAWLLRPVPFVPAARVGTMIGLALSTVSLLLDQYDEVLAAVRARGLMTCGNLFRRFLFTIRPFVGKTFRRADELALAMEARCYRDDAVPPLDGLQTRDWILVGTSLGVVITVLLWR